MMWIFLSFIIFIFSVVSLFLPWLNQRRIDVLEKEIRVLKKKLREGGIVFDPKKVSGDQQADAHEPPVKAVPKTKAALPKEQKVVDRSSEINEKKPKVTGNFEENIATKLPVWIGAVALIFGVFFLIKYSIDMGLLSPSVRVTLGALFGFGLVSGGNWVFKRENISNNIRVGQGLIGAGLVALYSSVYAMVNLYGFLSPVLGFFSMMVITAAAIVMSLRCGQPVAIFALIGGMATPAMVGSDSPNTLLFFSYLFILFSGLFYVLARKGWWLLAIIALIAVFGWSFFWFFMLFAKASSLIFILFFIALLSVVLAITGKFLLDEKIAFGESRHIHLLNYTAIFGAVFAIIVLTTEITIGLFDWAMLGLVSVALMAMSFFKPEIYSKALWVKGATTIGLFYFWADDVTLVEKIPVIIGILAIYVGGGGYLMRQLRDPRLWAAFQAAAACLMYPLCYFVTDLPESFLSSFSDIFWGIIGLILASLSIYQADDIRKKYVADKTIQEHLVAIYALAASAFISMALAIELPGEYLPMAIAGQVAATALIYKQTDIKFLRVIIFILLGIFTALHYKLFLLFGALAIKAIVLGSLNTGFVNEMMLVSPYFKLGLSVTLLIAAFFVSYQHVPKDQRLLNVIFAVSAASAAALFYFFVRDIFGGYYIYDTAYETANYGNLIEAHFFDKESLSRALAAPASFIERVIISVSGLMSACLMIKYSDQFKLNFLKLWGIALFNIVMARIIYFDFIMYNPYWSFGGYQKLGEVFLLNGVTLIYGATALACAWAISNKDKMGFDTVLTNFYKIIGFISLFAVTSLTVRHVFHGDNMAQGQGVQAVELYWYSVTWLLTGIGLLAYGIIKDNKSSRMASLAFMLLTVFKVFLIDTSELEGLYRVFSFLGLGGSLIALSVFYTRFVFKK